MMEAILAPENLQRAWQRVRTNAGAPGVDGMTVAAFPAFCRQLWSAIRSALRSGTYLPFWRTCRNPNRSKTRTASFPEIRGSSDMSRNLKGG